MVMDEKYRVVITGIGPICSLGFGKDEVWDSILKTRLNLIKTSYEINGEKWGDFFIHKMKNFNIDDFKLPKQNFNFVDNIRGFKDGDIDLYYFLAVVKLAMESSGLTYNHDDNDVGLVLTQENPGVESFFDTVIDSAHDFLNTRKDAAAATKLQIAQGLYQQCEEPGYSLQTFSYIYSVAKVFDMHGSSLFINNACASGLFAIEAASNQLRSGANSAVVVAAIENPTKIYKYLWFKKNGLYAEDGITRPYSKETSGIVFGDGGCALVMETLENAKKRGAHVYGEYMGGGFSLEGWKIMVPNITEDFYSRSFKKALKNANVKPEDIDFVNPHGVGMKITDTYEATTINNVFGSRKPLVSAFKPLIGHNLGGSALLETAISLMALENNIVPATLNCENPNPKLNLEIVRENRHVDLNMVSKMSCGFAGFSGVSIFKKYNT